MRIYPSLPLCERIPVHGAGSLVVLLVIFRLGMLSAFADMLSADGC
ncbi:MAG: hypothetical protein HOA30_14190 [Rhodospirillaceae bacterium]|jgi:hypothetical protein|nr:hypothetical protein [Rhodospirillaceae bacterium]MBT5513231.1 hypothetical protein [Rhodospirillaceae bacterium]MBT6885189.1 hypothetical protein [Rhodospirillaceae bacterium]